MIKTTYINPRFLSDSELKAYNQLVYQKFKQINVDASQVYFDLNDFQYYIEKEKSFIKGLIEYLIKLQNQLMKISENQEIILQSLEIFSDIGSLVYPNTNACYSIIPKDLSKINWKKELNKIRSTSSKPSEIYNLLTVFETLSYEKSVCCIISLCLSDLFNTFEENEQNITLVDGQKVPISEEYHNKPRVKISHWIGRLTEYFRQHLEGCLKKSIEEQKNQNLNESINPQTFLKIEEYAQNFAIQVTMQILVKHGLFESYNTITNDKKSLKNPNYYVWAGSNLIAFPKTVALPMIVKPKNWELISITEKEDLINYIKGGYYLSEFTNISYVGYLDSKTNRHHSHKLIVKKFEHLNYLQNVSYKINSHMVEFIDKYRDKLTKNDILLCSNKWLKPSQEDVEKIIHKYSKKNGRRFS